MGIKYSILKGNILLFFILALTQGVFASPWNSGIVREEPIIKESFNTGIDCEDYYDCTIPFNKSYYNIGGFFSENSSLNMPEDLYNEKVGNKIAILDKVHNYDKVGEYQGLDLYNVGDNNLFAVSLPYYCFEINGDTDYDIRLGWDDLNIGKLADIILNSGDCYHCVIADLEPCYKYNATCEVANPYTYPMNYSTANYGLIYDGLFNAVDGSILKIAGKEGNILEESLKSGNSIADIRIYDVYANNYKGFIDDSVSNVSVEDQNISLSELTDELEPESYTGDYVSETPGMGKNNYMSSYFYLDTTKNICLKHVKDFKQKSSWKKIMKKAGGYTEYLKSLGGVFESVPGEKNKIKLNTLGDLYAAHDYVYGLIAIYGFSYWCNDRTGHWKGGSKYSFYGSGTIAQGNVWTNIDSRCDGSISNMCTTFCDSTCKALSLKCEGYKYKGKQKKSFSNKSVKDVAEYIKTGMMVSVAYKGGMGHTFMVGEVTDKYVRVWTTGHDLTNSGNNWREFPMSKLKKGKGGGTYLNPKKLNGISLYVGCSKSLKEPTNPNPSFDIKGEGKKAYDSESDETEGEKEEEEIDLNHGFVTPEDQIVGLKGEIYKVNDEAQQINLPDSNSLNAHEKVSVQIVKENALYKKQNWINEIIGTTVVAIGLFLLVYIALLWACYIFDRVNSIINISAIKIITLGRYEISDEGNKDSKHEMTLQRMILTSTIAFFVSWAIISGAVYGILQNMINSVVNFIAS